MSQPKHEEYGGVRFPIEEISSYSPTCRGVRRELPDKSVSIPRGRPSSRHSPGSKTFLYGGKEYIVVREISCVEAKKIAREDKVAQVERLRRKREEKIKRENDDEMFAHANAVASVMRSIRNGFP